MKLFLASAVFLASAMPVLAQAPAPAPAAPQTISPQAPAATAAAPSATPRDPKSPVAGIADGRGPTGPVQVTILSPKPDEVIPIPPAAAGQPAATGAPVEVKIDLKDY